MGQQRLVEDDAAGDADLPITNSASASSQSPSVIQYIAKQETIPMPAKIASSRFLIAGMIGHRAEHRRDDGDDQDGDGGRPGEAAHGPPSVEPVGGDALEVDRERPPR